jgi:CRP/FNR family cyclic AMP-dependent transcriptional regulator
VLTTAVADARAARSNLAELFAGGRHREMSRGARVMLQGEAGSTIARIVAGRVKIVHAAPSGDEMLLAIVGPGEVVGDFEAFEPSPAYRRASVVALDAVTLHTVSAEEYLAFLHTHPAAAIERLQAVILLLRSSGRRRTEWISMRATARLAVVLGEMAETESGDRAEIAGLTQHELGALVGASDDSVSRALQELERRGLLSKARRRITVASRARLAEFTDGLFRGTRS